MCLLDISEQTIRSEICGMCEAKDEIALGMIFLHFRFQPMSEVLNHVEHGYRMEAPDGCPKEVYSIMRQAWDAIPNNRPSFAVVVEKLNSLLTLTPSSP